MSEAPHPSGDDRPSDRRDENDRPAEPKDAEARGEETRAEDGSSKDEGRSGPKRDVLDLSQGDGEERDGASYEDEESEPDGKPSKGKGAKDDGARPPPKMVFVIAGLILLAAVAWGGWEHWSSYRASKQTTADTKDRVVEVRTVAAKTMDQPVNLTLPGETQAYATASLYPRATGYVTQRLVDIGSRVKKNDLLLHIAAPDLDQQLAQAEAQIGQTRASLTQATAQVAQAEANLNLANVNLNRTDILTKQGYETQQNRDTQLANSQTQQANLEAAKAGVRVAEANVKAQQATIDRLKALTAFEDVRAPFDGVITSRNVDVGDLLNADTSTSTPIFSMVRDDVIRVMVRVPQSLSDGIHDGIEAKIKVQQAPKLTFSGRVTRSSVALLYSSRTLTTEVDVPNPTGELRPGYYVTVTLEVPRDHPEVNVPAEALIFNQHGMQVASVENDQVKLHQVNIARDLGTSVDLREGVKGGDRVIVNPPATLKNDAKVKETKVEDEKKQEEQKQQQQQEKQGDQSAKQDGTSDGKDAQSTEAKSTD